MRFVGQGVQVLGLRAMPGRGSAKRWLMVSGLAVAAVVLGAVALTAARGGGRPALSHVSAASRAAGPVPGGQAAATPAECHSQRCSPAGSHDLGGYTITVWHAGPADDYVAKPLLELVRGGIAVQWLSLPQGHGWSGALTCDPTACVFTDGQGAHSGLAQLIILSGGRLSAPSTGSAGFDLPTVSVRAAGGSLDVLGIVSDYRPNFAQGHFYWQTLRLAGDRLTSTGCAPRSAPAAAPTRELTGACPQPSG